MCRYCSAVLDKIEELSPNGDWNMGEPCEMWHKLAVYIPDNHIEFEDGSDECYGCTCPYCGEMVCGWCV